MGESSQGVDAPTVETPPRPAATPQRSLRSKWRDPAKLKLLATLRGEGLLTWTGGDIPVAYSLDLFAAGAARNVSGQVDGDLSALLAPREGDEAQDMPLTASLRLADGQAVQVELSDLEADFAEFHARDVALTAPAASL